MDAVKILTCDITETQTHISMTPKPMISPVTNPLNMNLETVAVKVTGGAREGKKVGKAISFFMGQTN